MTMTITRFSYPVELTPDENGRIVARVVDLAGCVTDGSDQAEALAEAADALEEILADNMVRGLAIPPPSAARGRPVVAPGAVIAAKAALHLAMRDASIGRTALAERLGVDEKAVRRMLDPKHATKIGALEEALGAAGRKLVITVEAA
ncbi:MAG: type II toxin-antitoxin system HicB family antitoxin [Alphaproteobacteria bacterium]|nr:type II toxin-antitoxin system HicB family antitoxin [Alphaproteobacteria bacterium]